MDNTGCWEWTGERYPSNYGLMRITSNGKRKAYRAHRVSWAIYRKTPPDNKYVCHRCDNPPCVNPDHLFLGTQLDNIRDAISKNRLRPASGNKNGNTTKPESRPRGESNGSAKLKVADVLYIRASHRNGISHRELSNKFRVSKSTISRTLNNENWTHI
jgi:hypothetical protein